MGWSRCCTAICNRILENQADNLEVEDAQVLASAVSTANLDDNANAWVSILENARLLYVALCDVNCCGMAVAILQRLIVTTVGRAGFPWQRGKKSNWRVETFVWQ